MEWAFPTRFFGQREQSLVLGSGVANSNLPNAGPAPANFKGFANEPGRAAFGSTFSARPPNSSHPPATVPRFMAVIASSSITASGQTIFGDAPEIAIVQTAPDYAPNPGHPGTGTVAAVLCGGTNSVASAP